MVMAGCGVKLFHISNHLSYAVLGFACLDAVGNTHRLNDTFLNTVKTCIVRSINTWPDMTIFTQAVDTHGPKLETVYVA